MQRIAASGSSSWLTPDTNPERPNLGSNRLGDKSVLSQADRDWPTPHGNCWTGAWASGREGGLNIQTAVSLWPTPSAWDGAAGARQPDGKRDMQLRDLCGTNAPLWARGLRENEPVDLPVQPPTFWPTPTTSDDRTHSVAPTHGNSHGRVLGGVAAEWPTPTVNGNNNRADLSEKAGNGLATEAKLWPTASANDGKESSRPGQRRGQLDEAAEQLWATPRTAWASMIAESRETMEARGHNSRETLATQANSLCSRPDPANSTSGRRSSADIPHLNPLFVTHLMGWPLGWSDAEGEIEWNSFVSWATASSHWLQLMLSARCGTT